MIEQQGHFFSTVPGDLIVKTAVYKIVRRGQEWAIHHDDEVEGSYATKEGAFEAIIGAASNSIKDGFGVSIHIPASSSDESALGAD